MPLTKASSTATEQNQSNHSSKLAQWAKSLKPALSKPTCPTSSTSSSAQSLNSITVTTEITQKFTTRKQNGSHSKLHSMLNSPIGSKTTSLRTVSPVQSDSSESLLRHSTCIEGPYHIKGSAAESQKVVERLTKYFIQDNEDLKASNEVMAVQSMVVQSMVIHETSWQSILKLCDYTTALELHAHQEPFIQDNPFKEETKLGEAIAMYVEALIEIQDHKLSIEDVAERQWSKLNDNMHIMRVGLDTVINLQSQVTIDSDTLFFEALKLADQDVSVKGMNKLWNNSQAELRRLTSGTEELQYHPGLPYFVPTL